MSILEYQHLSLNYGNQVILQNIDFKVEKNKFTVIVGQSGSGKSTLLKATLGLLSDAAQISQGKILFNNDDLLQTNLLNIRGKKIGMIFQNPLTYFDDFKTIGVHFYEVLHQHFNYTKNESEQISKQYLSKLALDEKILNQYPFEISGGMAQRVMIALVLCLKPDVILADEPTSSLDVINQKQILDLLKSIKSQTTWLFVTHNIDVAKYLADQIIVIKEGKIIEKGSNQDIFLHPTHSYTKLLIEKG